MSFPMQMIYSIKRADSMQNASSSCDEQRLRRLGLQNAEGLRSSTVSSFPLQGITAIFRPSTAPTPTSSSGHGPNAMRKNSDFLVSGQSTIFSVIFIMSEQINAGQAAQPLTNPSLRQLNDSYASKIAKGEIQVQPSPNKERLSAAEQYDQAMKAKKIAQAEREKQEL